MGSSLSEIRTQLRTLIDDLESPPSHFVRQEDLRNSPLGDQVAAGINFFQLANRRIVELTAATTTLVVIKDGVQLTPVTGYTDDPIRGTFVLVGSLPTTSLFARYDFTLFLDSELNPPIEAGLRFLGLASGISNISTDVANVPEGLNHALLLEAASQCFEALASRTAPLYDASAAGKTLNKKSIKDHYLALAKQKHEEAMAALENFYKRQGRRDAPAFGQFSTQQKVYTPIR